MIFGPSEEFLILFSFASELHKPIIKLRMTKIASCEGMWTKQGGELVHPLGAIHARCRQPYGIELY